MQQAVLHDLQVILMKNHCNSLKKLFIRHVLTFVELLLFSSMLSYLGRTMSLGRGDYLSVLQTRKWTLRLNNFPLCLSQNSDQA